MCSSDLLKLGGEYTGTWVFNRRRHWFAQLNARVTGGPADYDGWCRPWQIEPSATSSNGYRLTLGTRSKCTEDNDSDWYAEGRVVVGTDLFAHGWSLSPYVGLGVRHLANGITGVRDAGSDLSEIDGWRALAEAGVIDGPRIIRPGPILNGKSFNRYQLAVGDTGQARRAYQDFLALWKDADPDVPVLREAQAEYAKLAR